MIIAISSSEDAHIDFVRCHLTSEMITLDPPEVTVGKSLSYDLSAQEPRVIYRGTTLSAVKSVWLRKPTLASELTLPVSQLYKEYSESALHNHGYILYNQFSDALWMSDFFAARRASDKPWQLRAAARIGFRVPPTLFTSDETAAAAFIKSHAATIVKPIEVMFPSLPDGKGKYVFYATKVQRHQQVNLKGLHVAPAIFQKAIELEVDIRVTVVGEKVFAAAIKTGHEGSSSVRDWRFGYIEGGLDIEKFELPRDVQDKCVTLVKHLGLAFGAIDLIKDKKGRIWFIEINPNGQWAFVEDMTGHQIGMTIAEALERGSCK